MVRSLLLLSVAIVITTTLVVVARAADVKWGYNDRLVGGPSRWGELTSVRTGELLYPMCHTTQASSQGPMNLVQSSFSRQLSTPSLSWIATANYTLENDGVHITVTPHDVVSSVMHDGVTYNLQHITFLTRSGHAFGSSSFDLEVLAYHTISTGGDESLYVSLLFAAGTGHHDTINELIANIPSSGSAAVIQSSFAPKDLLPPLDAFVSYDATIPHPPCDIPAKYVVYTFVGQISTMQLAALRAAVNLPNMLDRNSRTVPSRADAGGKPRSSQGNVRALPSTVSTETVFFESVVALIGLCIGVSGFLLAVITVIVVMCTERSFA